MDATLAWLLEPDNPSVRYFTLVDLLDRPSDDPAVLEARDRIADSGPVPKILQDQRSGGYWDKPEDFYVRAKYRGTVWQIIALAELGADGRDPRVRAAADFILDRSQHPESGGFAFHGLGPGAGGDPRDVIPCLTGNMVWSLVRFGYVDDPRVLRGLEWIARYQRFDDGGGAVPAGWPYDAHERCWGRHTCHMGVVKALKALAEARPEHLPVGARSARASAVARGADYLLRHHVYKRSHDLGQVSKAEWLRFGFPRMWDTDVLEILGILTRLGYRDERMGEAVDLLRAKRDEQARWKLERSYNGRARVRIESLGQSSKWVTLHALTVLRSWDDGGRMYRHESP